jgi:retinol-binding protein 3
MKACPFTFLTALWLSLAGSLSVAQPVVPKAMTPRLTRSVVDSIGRALQRYYVFPDKAERMSRHLQQQLQKGRYRNLTQADLAEQLTRDLQAVYLDGHLYIAHDPGLAQALLKRNPRRRLTDDSLALLHAREEYFGLRRVEILDGNIGYLPIYSFTPFVESARPAFSAALGFLASTRTLILDLRSNGGGSPEMVGALGSYFFAQKTPFTTIYNRVRDSTTVYWADPNQVQNLTLTMPVYILTSQTTFSAAEDFAYSMQQSKRALVIGDTTRGGAHPAGPFLLEQGFVIHLPFARSINPYSKTNWEGSGVIPDIPAKADRALEKAQELILTQVMEQAKEDRQKRKLQWALDELRAAQFAHLPTEPELKSYTGDYQGLIVYLLDGRLYCKNTGRGDQITQLKPIATDWFILNEQVHLEFLKSDGDHFSGLKLHWRDGREIPVDRSK